MRILICNDDGIDARGIQILAEVMGKEHDILVVAPESERSASSHALVSMRGVTYKKETRFAFEAYSCSGMPADCVKLGVMHLMPQKPDLVLSGINHGTNLGSDVIYSGTVSAAFEGVYSGVKSIAISAAYRTTEQRFYEIAEYIRENLKKLIALNIPSTSCLSVNYPSDHKILGAKILPLGTHRYSDGFKLCGDTIRLEGEPLPMPENERDCDIYWYNQGYVVISPIQNDRNDYLTLKRIKGDF